MVTPFSEGGELDVDGSAELARWLSSHGTDALVVAGTTGEGVVLSDEEKSELWRAVSEAVTVPVIAGTGTNDTRHSVELTKLATGCGVDAALVVTPYYNRPGQSGLFEHFKAVASATTLPVMLYDIPVRSGRKISSETMLRLAHGVGNIVGVKDAAGDVVASARLAADAPEGFDIYCGDDTFTLPLLAVGAVGVVSVASHWIGEDIAGMIAAFMSGDVVAARRENARLMDLVAFQSSETCPNPLPAKAMCRAMGLPAGQCRLPMGTAPAELDDRARRMLQLAGNRVHSQAEAAVGQVG